MVPALLGGKRRRKCNTRIYSIQLWYKQNKKNLLLRKTKNQTTNTRSSSKIASKNVLTWHCPIPKCTFIETPVVMATLALFRADWHLVCSSVAVCSVFLVLAENSIPPSNLLPESPRQRMAAVLHRFAVRTVVGKGHTIPGSQEAQFVTLCDIWPRRLCRHSQYLRAFLPDNDIFSSYTVLFSSFLFCRIIRFSSVCFGFFRLLCFLHFWLNYCKKNKNIHCQTGSGTLQ